MHEINRKMTAGIVWMSLMRFGIKGLGLINTVVLARLLVPDDFGLVAIAMSVISALELMRAFGFDVALIQGQDLDRSHYDTAWTFNILFGLGVAFPLLIVAPVAGSVFNEPRLPAVLQLLAVGIFVSGFENVGVVAFRKDLAFHKEFVMRVVQKACNVAITLPLAFALKSYWALVIGMVSGNVLAVLVSYYAHSFRPRLSLAARGHLFSFSKWLLATNVIWFARDRIPEYVLARVIGAGGLGLFTVSLEISNLPTTELISPINRAVFPAYAKLAHNPNELAQGFLNVIGLIVLVALPAGFGIAVTSGLIVDVVLGPNWSAAAPAISVLAIFGALNALTTNCGAVFYALGRPKTVAVLGAIHAGLLLPAVVWSAYYYGAIGVAWAYLAVVVLIVPVTYAVVLSYLRLSFRRVWLLLWRPGTATAVMYVVTRNWIVLGSDSTLAALLTAVAVGGATYITTVAALWLIAGRPVGPERTFMDRFFLPTWKRIVS